MKSKTVKQGQVYRKPEVGKILVARQDREFDFEVELIANYPHEGDDFSYLCGSDYCRCTQ